MVTSLQALGAGVRLQSAKRTYVIEKVLGQGGFGITYLANTTMFIDDIAVDVSVAIKELFISDLCERVPGGTEVRTLDSLTHRVASSRKDFLSEARRLQQVGKLSGNIVKVSEVFEANNTAYYVMEYLQGQSLAHYIKEKGALSADEVKALLSPIAEALRVLHANRMTHLDVKPDNIMLAKEKDGSMRPVLIDFGLAKHYDENGNATSTVGTMSFSEGYAPIEQYTGITTFSPASDVYALGATLYHALMGHRPPKASEVDLEKIAKELDSCELRDLVVAAMASAKTSRPLLDDARWQALYETETHEAEASSSPHSAANTPANASAAPLPESPRVTTESNHGTSVVTKILSDTKSRRPRRWPVLVGTIAAIVLLAIIIWPVGSGQADKQDSADDIVAANLSDQQLTESPAETSAPAAGIEQFNVNDVTFDMVNLPGGTFTMGSDDGDADEKPAHIEAVDSFSIGKTEVTQALWQAVMGNNPSPFKDDDLPVVQVSWNDCQEFIHKLNRLTGRKFRLPTEAEWEFAAVGGKSTAYSGSDNIGSVAWYDGNSCDTIHAVGIKTANEFGLHDMSGNVWEWTDDKWSSDYASPRNGGSGGFNRVNRGGSWSNYAASCRPSYRFSNAPSYRHINLGFRLAL